MWVGHVTSPFASSGANVHIHMCVRVTIYVREREHMYMHICMYVCVCMRIRETALLSSRGSETRYDSPEYSRTLICMYMCVCTRIRETVLLSSATSKTPNDSSEVQHRKLLTTHLKIQHSYTHLRVRVHENKKDGVTLECNIANFKRLISIFTNS